MARYEGRVHLDLGSGDGRGPYRWACRDSTRLFIAADASHDALLGIAWKAGRKPARGGVSNLICVAEPLEVLAAELGPVADRLTVILPWVGLLRAVALPEAESLRGLRRLCLPGAAIEIVFSYDAGRDAHDPALASLVLDEQHVAGLLPARYLEAGIVIHRIENISREELKTYGTTWTNRLAFGRERIVWRIRAGP